MAMEKKIFKYVKVLSVVGIVLAVYLLWEQATQSPFKPCNINSRVNCEAVISGEVAKTLGLPTALYGLVGYSVILMAAIYQKKKLMLAVATFGLGFCLYLAYRELWQLKVVCPICIACQLIMISVFTLAIILNRTKKG